IELLTLHAYARVDLPPASRTSEEKLPERLIGYYDRVIVAWCAQERLPFALDHTHHAVLQVLDLDFLTNCNLALWKKSLCYLKTQQYNIAPALNFIRRKESPLFDINLKDFVIAKRSTGKRNIANAVVCILDDNIPPSGEDGDRALILQVGGKEPVIAVRGVGSAQKIPPLILLPGLRKKWPFLDIDHART